MPHPPFDLWSRHGGWVVRSQFLVDHLPQSQESRQGPTSCQCTEHHLAALLGSQSLHLQGPFCSHPSSWERGLQTSRRASLPCCGQGIGEGSLLFSLTPNDTRSAGNSAHYTPWLSWRPPANSSAAAFSVGATPNLASFPARDTPEMACSGRRERGLCYCCSSAAFHRCQGCKGA